MMTPCFVMLARRRLIRRRQPVQFGLLLGEHVGQHGDKRLHSLPLGQPREVLEVVANLFELEPQLAAGLHRGNLSPGVLAMWGSLHRPMAVGGPRPSRHEDLEQGEPQTGECSLHPRACAVA